MTPPAPLVCLITPGHVASTPRLVKNADALAGAGYRVHVVSHRHFPPIDALDAEIFASGRWSHAEVGSRRAARESVSKLLRRAARWLAKRQNVGLGVAVRAHNAAIPRLAKAAAAVPAQFYFGHCLAGLPAAAMAARRRGVLFGFDAEDFHDAETEAGSVHAGESAARRTLQSRLLPACQPFTAASPLIAREYQKAYGRSPIPILNVFPLAQAPHPPAEEKH